MPLSIEHLHNQDANTNLAQDLAEFSDAEKKELNTIQNQVINTKLDQLDDNILQSEQKESIYAELGAKLLLGQTIDSATRAMTDKTDDELKLSAVKKVYATLGGNSKRDFTSNKHNGFWNNSPLAKAIQQYINKSGDGKFGEQTKKDIENFLTQHEPAPPTPTNTNEQQNPTIDTSPDHRSIDSDLDKKLGELDTYTRKYGNFLANRFGGGLSDGAFCTLYVKMALAEMAHHRDKQFAIRDISAPLSPNETGGTRSLKSRIEKIINSKKKDGTPSYQSEYISMQNFDINNPVTQLSQLPAGGFFTLQYTHSHYKSKGVTHAIVAHGNGKFSHRFGKKRQEFSINDIKYDASSQQISIHGSQFLIHADSRIYTPQRDKLPSHKKQYIINEYPVTGLEYAQILADQYTIPKEYIITQLYRQGYDLSKRYKTGELRVPLCVESPKSYQRSYHFELQNPDFESKFGQFKDECSDHERAMMKAVYINENNKGNERKTIKEWYKNNDMPLYMDIATSPLFLAGKFSARSRIETLKWLKTWGRDKVIDSFGPFQLNKYYFIKQLSKNPLDTAVKDLIPLFIKNTKNGYNGSTVGFEQRRKQLSQDDKVQEAEHWLCQDDIAFRIAKNYMGQSEKEITAHIIKDDTINEDDLVLSTMFDHNKGRKGLSKALAQQNFYLLAQHLKLPPPATKFYIDGEMRDATGGLIQQVCSKLNISHQRNALTQTITISNKPYNCNKIQDIKSLFMLLQSKPGAKDYQYRAGLSVADLRTLQNTGKIHLHYGYTLLESSSPQSIIKETANERYERLIFNSKKTDVYLSRTTRKASSLLSSDTIDSKYKNRVIHLKKSQIPYYPMPQTPTTSKQGGYLVYQGQCAENGLKPGSPDYASRNNTSLINTMMSDGNFAYAILTNGVIVSVGDPTQYSAGAGHKAMLHGDPMVQFRGHGIEVAGSVNPSTRDLYPPTPAQLESMKRLREHLSAQYSIPADHVTTSRQVSEGDGHTDTQTRPNSPDICKALDRTPAQLSSNQRGPDPSQSTSQYNNLIDQRIAISQSYLAKARSEKEKEQIQKSIQYRLSKKGQ